MIYRLLLFSFFLLGLGELLIKKNKNFVKLLAFLTASFVCVFAGLRWEVWTDWDNYVAIFKEPFASHALLSVEFGYLWLCYLFLEFVSQEIIALNVFVVVLFLISVFSNIKLLEVKYYLLVFIPLFAYVLGISGTRTYIAISITLFSVLFIIRRQPVLFLITVFFSCLFHKTAIIFLPAYFFFSLKPRGVALIIGASLLIYVTGLNRLVLDLFKPLLSFLGQGFETKYMSYLTGTEELTVGSFLGISKRIFFFLLLLAAIFNKSNQKHIFIVNMYGLSVAIWIISISFPGLLRLSIYYEVFIVYAFSIFFIVFKKAYNRALLIVFFTLFFFYSAMESRLSGVYKQLYIPHKIKVMDSIITFP